MNMPLIFLDPEEENPICISGVFKTTAWIEIVIMTVFFLAFAVTKIKGIF